jgi:D-2-hydroxyacid dehydrogenase (NADP+)
MIGIRTEDSFLKIADIEELLSKKLGKDESWKIYPDIKSMLPDKDKIEIIINAGKINQEDLEALDKLKWIFSYSAGVDSYPLEYLEKRGIVLTNTSGVHAKNIAEQVMGAMIMFSRNLITALRKQEEKIYDKNIPVGELTGQNLLIVGTGSIGKEIARKAKAFDMNICGIRNRSAGEIPKYFDEIYSVDSLDDRLGDFHYIVCVVPSTDKTRGLFDRRKFDLMNPNTVFINVGRGDLIVEDDLTQALKTKRIRGAYLDVFPNEPLPSDSELWGLDNLLITPHNAGSTPKYFSRAMEIFLENLKKYRTGEELINKINYGLKY